MNEAMTTPRFFQRRAAVPALLLAFFVSVGACSSDPEIPGKDSDSDDDNGDDSNDDSSDSGTDSLDGLGLGGNGSGGTGDGSGGNGPVCETASSEAELKPIFLAFAFDVSGSMGKLDRPNWWHDPDLKWTPIVQATTAFFEAEDSSGISASMTLFPAASSKCSASTYEDPDVAMTTLPSGDFGDALGDYEDEVDAGGELAGGDWRGDTPTLQAVTGTSVYLDSFRAVNPDAKFAIVLVTDGVPAGCSQDIDDVIDEVEGLAADDLITYVIGVENPTEAPDALPSGWSDWGDDCDDGAAPCDPPANLSPLNQVAAAGGTESAFLIVTGDPEATRDAFKNAIDAIRAEAISCELGIPEHPTPGQSFDKDKINVSVTVGGDKTDFAYDPDCEDENSWHYDDEDDPSFIELCPSTCAEVQATPGADLNVDFLCQVRPDVVR